LASENAAETAETNAAASASAGGATNSSRGGGGAGAGHVKGCKGSGHEFRQLRNFGNYKFQPVQTNPHASHAGDEKISRRPQTQRP
jgi:hypothetical protein